MRLGKTKTNYHFIYYKPKKKEIKIIQKFVFSRRFTIEKCNDRYFVIVKFSTIPLI